MALDDKRILIFDKNTGDIKRNLPFSESNSRRDLAEDESLIVVPVEIKLASFPDDNDTVFETTIPEDEKTEKNRVHDANISGPIRYRSPNRTRQSADVSAKIILGGQHHYAESLNGRYIPTGTSGDGNARFYFYSLQEFEPLKLLRGDHFQILYPSHDILDGIYKVTGFTDKALNTVKVSGATTDGGVSGGFYFVHGGGSGEEGYHMIRLQPFNGSTFGLSAAYEGDGIYQYNERITQSPINVYNSGEVKVVHNHDEFKTGGSSALFPADPGGTGAYLVTDHVSTMDPTGSGTTGDNNFFKLSLWFKFATSPKATDKFILGQKNTDGEGFYQLKYQRSPKAFVFDYSTDATAADFDNSFTALVPSYTPTSWAHLQVEAVPGKEVRFYLNGTLIETDALTSTEAVFESAGGSIPFQMGVDPEGTLGAANAYYDDVLVQHASLDDFTANTSLQFIDGPTGSTAALGITFSTPTTGHTSNAFTTLNFRMNGPSGGELFTEDGHENGVVTGNMVDYDHHRRVLTVANYGITGATSNAFDVSNGFIRGYGEGYTNANVGDTGNSEAIHPMLRAVVGITAQGANLENLKKVIIESQDLYRDREFYATGMSGSSGSSNDFVNLFGVAGSCADFAARVLTFAPTDNEVIKINAAIAETAVSGVSLTAPLVFSDISGASFSIEEKYLKAFGADVSAYRQTVDNSLSDDVAEIEVATDISDLAQDGPNAKLSITYDQYAFKTPVTFPSRG